jgi:hypothetical protein
MTVASRLRKEWERRLPDLGSIWTHWRLEGEGSLIAVVPGERLAEALRLIAENAQRYASINAFRARANPNGECAAIEKQVFEKSNRGNDEKMIGALGPE